MGNDLDLAIADLGDLDGLAQVADAALDLDLLVQELLESGDIEDLVAGGLRGVDDELERKDVVSVALGYGSLFGGMLLTFLVVLEDLPFFCEFENLTLAYCITP